VLESARRVGRFRGLDERRARLGVPRSARQSRIAGSGITPSYGNRTAVSFGFVYYFPRPLQMSRLRRRENLRQDNDQATTCFACFSIGFIFSSTSSTNGRLKFNVRWIDQCTHRFIVDTREIRVNKKRAFYDRSATITERRCANLTCHRSCQCLSSVDRWTDETLSELSRD